jgi:hypothetical protein
MLVLGMTLDTSLRDKPLMSEMTEGSGVDLCTTAKSE